MNVSNTEELFLLWSQCKVPDGLSCPSVVGQETSKVGEACR